MSMQTKIAFKVDEIKRQHSLNGSNNTDKPEIDQKNTTEDIDNDDEEEEEEPQQDVNPFFREPLYVGNLSLQSSSERYYRWIIFISSSPTEIVKPKSISSVTYHLHPNQPNPKRTKKSSPFFLDISGWGIFQIDIEIKFKNNFIRPSIETAHMLSIDSATSITCIEDGSRHYHQTLFKYQHFKQFRNEKEIGKVSFVKKAKHRLQRNLLKTPPPIYFEGFTLRLPQFKSMFKQCIEEVYHNNIHIPETIYNIIGYFAVFAWSLYNIMPNQEVYIEECHNCDIVISAPKFNHLRLRRCSNVMIKFPYIMSKCELIDCDNIRVVCSGLCYTYRLDTSDNINVEFLDPGTRVTFLCFNSPHIWLKCMGIQWQEPRMHDDDELDDLNRYSDKEKYPDTLMYEVPFEKGEKERLSVRWRTDKSVEWSWKIFHAKYTLGSASRR